MATISCRTRRGTGFAGYAFVANQEGQAVAAVDLTAFAVAKHIRLDGNPTEVIAHTQRPSVYALTPDTGSLHEIQADHLDFLRKLPIASAVVSMRLTSDGNALYFLCPAPRRLVRVHLDSFRIDAQIPLPLDPVDFELSADGKTAAVSFGPAGSIGFVDLVARRTAVVSVGAEVGKVLFHNHGKTLLAANLAQRMLFVYDVATRRLVVQLPLAVRPENFCFKSDGGQPNDGGQLFITGEGMDAVVIVYPYDTPEVAQTVLAGHAPGPMAASQNPDYLFIASPSSGDVSILDIFSERVIAAVTVGAEPGYVLITPDNQYALVLNRKSGDMSVLRIAAVRARSKSPASQFTMIPVGSKPVSAVVRAV